MIERRSHLIAFRVEQNLTQTQMAKLCKVSLRTYHAIENCKADGKLKFWELLQKIFNLTGEKICFLQEKQKIQES